MPGHVELSITKCDLCYVWILEFQYNKKYLMAALVESVEMEKGNALIREYKQLS